MKSLLENINKAFDHRIRLAIMSVLMVNESADFNTLKELLGVTDGNLASHTRALTSYKTTKKGREAFQEHLNALEKLANLSISR